MKTHPPRSHAVMSPHHVSEPNLRVAVVEDDDDIRAHLVVLISRAAGFNLAGRYGSAEEALAGIPHHPPDVVLMDIQLPGLSGIECVRALKQRLPNVQFLMLTIYEDSEQIFQSLQAGASGYLLKRTASAQLLEGIRDVYAGGSPMNSHIARKVVQFFNQRQRATPELESLSVREQEVLELLSRGQLYKEIAAQLGVTLDTVRKHLQSTYQKLHVHSRTEAVVKYLQR
jgi:DNA-binding NarL/FixJ family response regulator